jgi:hypothetical protein
VVGEDLLGQRLVGRQRQPERVAARVGLLLEHKVADHVREEEGVAVELFEEVEGDVGRAILDGLADDAEVAVNLDRPDLVPQLAQGRDHVVLGAPHFLRLVLDACERVRRDTAALDERDDAQLPPRRKFHSAILW